MKKIFCDKCGTVVLENRQIKRDYGVLSISAPLFQFEKDLCTDCMQDIANRLQSFMTDGIFDGGENGDHPPE